MRNFAGSDIVIQGGDLSCLGEIEIHADSITIEDVDLTGTKLNLYVDDHATLKYLSLKDTDVNVFNTGNRDAAVVDMIRVGMMDSHLRVYDMGILKISSSYFAKEKTYTNIYASRTFGTLISNSFFENTIVHIEGNIKPMIYASGFFLSEPEVESLQFVDLFENPKKKPTKIEEFAHSGSKGACIANKESNKQVGAETLINPEQIEYCPKIFKTWTDNLKVDDIKMNKPIRLGATKFIDLGPRPPEVMKKCEYVQREQRMKNGSDAEMKSCDELHKIKEAK